MNKAKRNRICIFRNDIVGVGGIETWLFNIATKYHKTHDITIYYSNAAKNQLDRLLPLVRCIEYTGQEIECETAIWCYDFLGYETVTADRKIHVVHADYAYGYNMDLGQRYMLDVDEIYAVSRRAAESATKLFGRKVNICYNLVLPEREERPIKIVSGTRLSREKGAGRMVELAKELNRQGVNFTWEIYTNTPDNKSFIDIPNVVMKPQVMDMLDKIREADFMVQLSDTESFGYSIVESMVVGTKLVVTDIPVLDELRINDNNAIIVPLENADYASIVRKIVAQAPYVPPKSETDKLLGEPTKSDYTPVRVMNISRGDVFVDGIWLESGQVAIINKTEDNPMLKEIK